MKTCCYTMHAEGHHSDDCPVAQAAVAEFERRSFWERAASENPWKLSARECEVAAALVNHPTAKAAAKFIGISHFTVQDYIRDGMRKMGVNNKLTAAVMYDRYSRRGVA